MYIHIYKVQTKLVQCIRPPPPPQHPPPPNYFGKEEKEEKKKTKEKKCNLFHACLYFKEDILNQNH